MPPTPIELDRHQRLKNRHRRAIAEAAVALTHEFGAGNFTAEQLAKRADVARRTVFNHFRSIDDAIFAGLTLILETATETVAHTLRAAPARRQEGEGDLASAFDGLVAAFLDVDLVEPLAQIVSAVGSRETGDPRVNEWATGVFGSIIPLLDAATEVLAPKSPASSRALLVRSMLAALSVAFDEWYLRTDGIDDHRSRIVWRAVLHDALLQLHAGFGANPAH